MQFKKDEDRLEIIAEWCGWQNGRKGWHSTDREGLQQTQKVGLGEPNEFQHSKVQGFEAGPEESQAYILTGRSNPSE